MSKLITKQYEVGVGASYFSIPPACWGGTFASGNTVVITTVQPCVPVWENRVLDADSSAIASQTRTLYEEQVQLQSQVEREQTSNFT